MKTFGKIITAFLIVFAAAFLAKILSEIFATKLNKYYRVDI